jgi:predicted nucleic acid-binding protein
MLIVADTSPINYLILIGQIDVLARLYNRITIPPAVLGELNHPRAPQLVRNWSARPPSWLDVLRPKSIVAIPRLDPGETEAIALAGEMHADALLIDDQAGRQEAARRGLRVASTLSVLDEADRAGLADFEASVARLLLTSFRISQAVWAESRTGDPIHKGRGARCSCAKPGAAADNLTPLALADRCWAARSNLAWGPRPWGGRFPKSTIGSARRGRRSRRWSRAGF